MCGREKRETLSGQSESKGQTLLKGSGKVNSAYKEVTLKAAISTYD
jgi:hypothetical protein